MARIAGQLNPIINFNVLMRTSEQSIEENKLKTNSHETILWVFIFSLPWIWILRNANNPLHQYFKVLWSMHTVNSVLNNDIISILTKPSNFYFVCLGGFCYREMGTDKKSDTFEDFCYRK